MDVVPHRSAPTIKKLGSIRARRSGRPAVTSPHRATRLPHRCQPVAAGRALRRSAQACPPGLDVVSWLGLIGASSRDVALPARSIVPTATSLRPRALGVEARKAYWASLPLVGRT